MSDSDGKAARKQRVISAGGAVVLEALLEEPDRQWYGFEIIKRTGTKSGMLYPLLRRLESRGVLKGGWEKVDPRVVGRPPRRLYRLTYGGSRARKLLAERRKYDEPP